MLPAQGLAGAAWLRSHRWRARLLCAPVRAGKMVAALGLLRARRRPLVGDRRWRLLPAGNEKAAWHAGHHPGMGTPQERHGHGSSPGSREYRMSDAVTIHTDGACKGNPGPGGWGALLEWGGHTKELFGGEPHTTNNRMELTAVIRALESLKRDCAVDIYTDSQYVKNGIESWIHGCKKNGWRTSA